MPRQRITVKVEPVQKRWLTKQEAMYYLGVGEDFLTKLRNGAEVSFSQVGKRIWYDLRSLDRYVEKHSVC